MHLMGVWRLLRPHLHCAALDVFLVVFFAGVPALTLYLWALQDLGNIGRDNAILYCMCNIAAARFDF